MLVSAINRSCSHAPASSSSHRRPRRVTRFVVYLRVSTLRQGASGLGIEAQREAVARHVASIGGRILAEVVETESGKQIIAANRQSIVGTSR